MRRRSTDWEPFVWTGIAIVAVCILVYLVFLDARAKQACEDRGGHVEEYDCHMVYTTQSCGKGCTILVPQEYCSWRCAGLPPEAP